MTITFPQLKRYAQVPSPHREEAVSSEPHDPLRAAREAAGMTQGQLAELANTWVERVTGKPGAMDADYIGKLERGIHRWPNQQYRAALRFALRRQLDAELGFFSTRSRAAPWNGTPVTWMEGTTWNAKHSCEYSQAQWPDWPSATR